MKPIDWLLGHLDEADVTEIVLGVGRPVAVRAAEGFRPITSMNFERTDIETLVAGTPLSGLIGSPTSLPPREMQVETRVVMVEVVRQGYDAAIRIAQVDTPRSARGTGNTLPPRNSSTTVVRTARSGSAPPPTVTEVVRTPRTGSTPPPNADDPRDVRRASPSSPPTTTPSRAAIPLPSELPLDEPPLVAVRMSKSTTTPPRTMTLSPPVVTPRPITPTAPPLAVTPVSTTTMPRIEAHAPMYLEPEPPAFEEPSGGEIDDVEGEHAQFDYSGTASYDQPPAEAYGGEVYAPEWYGPQIVDEHTDISALQALLDAAHRRIASDLHVISRQAITIRRLGDLAPLDVSALAPDVDRSIYSALMGPLDPTVAERFLMPLLGPASRAKLDQLGYVDLGFVVPGHGRVRANISRQQDGLAGCFRLGRAQIPTLDGLGLPRELEKCVRHHQGLVVLAGPSGHGKTTTMAALVDLLNTSNSDHIITIEDPVEIEHPAKKAIVSHREVGRHTISFVSALKASLREDPDVIVIGELRDRETVEIALAAAETGHLVLSTISTPSAVKTIDRLIDMFPPDDQVQVRASISGTLRAVIAQRLIPNAARDGMVAAIELVTGVLPLATMIRDNKLFQLPSLMQRGRAFGMIRLDDSLAEHVKAKRITEADALAAAENKRDLAALLQGRPTPTPTSTRGLFGGKGPA